MYNQYSNYLLFVFLHPPPHPSPNDCLLAPLLERDLGRLPAALVEHEAGAQGVEPVYGIVGSIDGGHGVKALLHIEQVPTKQLCAELAIEADPATGPAVLRHHHLEDRGIGY